MNEREKRLERARGFCFSDEDTPLGDLKMTHIIAHRMMADFAEAETQRLREANAVLMEAVVQVALICDSSYEATKAAVQAAIEKAKGVFE